jgi:hypothetical protein
MGEKLFSKTKATEYTIPISKSLSLRLYSDTRPHYLHIADLQKGLIFLYREAELVGEGVGFGVPIARYRDKTYFPGSSTMHILQKDDCTKIIKQFVLDIVFERRFGKFKIENKAMHKLSRLSDELYMKHSQWRLPLIELYNLSKNIGAQDSFVKGKPRGKVAVFYRIDLPFIHVKADFKSLEKNDLQKLFMLNEQGSRFFRKYRDSNGTTLLDEQIGAWEKAEADWAFISNKSGEHGFYLWKVEDSILYRGREFLKGTLDWVGLDYEIIPGKTCFEYDIEIFGSQRRR